MIDVKDIKEVVVCHKDDSMLEVSKLLRDSLSKHLYVIDDDQKVVGVISVRDIIFRVIAEEKDVNSVKVGSVMTSEISSISISSTYEEAFDVIDSLKTGSLPVVDENGVLQGSLTLWTIMGKLFEEEK